MNFSRKKTIGVKNKPTKGPPLCISPVSQNPKENEKYV